MDVENVHAETKIVFNQLSRLHATLTNLISHHSISESLLTRLVQDTEILILITVNEVILKQLHRHLYSWRHYLVVRYSDY